MGEIGNRDTYGILGNCQETGDPKNGVKWTAIASRNALKAKVLEDQCYGQEEMWVTTLGLAYIKSVLCAYSKDFHDHKDDFLVKIWAEIQSEISQEQANLISLFK